MVTVFDPVNRVVSIWASIAVSSPGLRNVLRGLAVTQPHETRTLEMLTGCLVLLTTRNWCLSIGPRGTEPKSLLNSSKRPSAQVAAGAAPAIPRPAKRTRLYRNMLARSCSTPRAAGVHAAEEDSSSGDNWTMTHRQGVVNGGGRKTTPTCHPTCTHRAPLPRPVRPAVSRRVDATVRRGPARQRRPRPPLLFSERGPLRLP